MAYDDLPTNRAQPKRSPGAPDPFTYDPNPRIAAYMATLANAGRAFGNQQRLAGQNAWMSAARAGLSGPQAAIFARQAQGDATSAYGGVRGALGAQHLQDMAGGMERADAAAAEYQRGLKMAALQNFFAKMMAERGAAGSGGGSWAQDATSGALAGSTFGPWGAAIGGVGGLIGSLFSGKGDRGNRDFSISQEEADWLKREYGLTLPNRVRL